MTDEQMQVIEHLLKKVNKKNDIYCDLLSQTDKLHTFKEFGYNYDLRLDISEYRKNAITFLIINNENEKLFMFTFFTITQDLYHMIYMWRKEDEQLRKISINEFKIFLGEYILLLGYARFSDKVLKSRRIGYRSKCIAIYIHLIKEISKRFSCSIYVEPEGLVELIKNGEFPECIEIEKINQEVLGMVDSGGDVTRKLAITLGLHEIKGYYNYYTFGPVFCSF